jgi:hypothetical protein
MVTLPVGATTGCARTGDAAPPPGDSSALRILVADNALRRPGEECSGSVPFLYIHKGATVNLEDRVAGKTIEIVLPAGNAIRSDSHDWGTSPRIPTNCEFIVDARQLTVGTYYWVDVDGKAVEHAYTYDPEITFQDLPTLTIPSAVTPTVDPDPSSSASGASAEAPDPETGEDETTGSDASTEVPDPGAVQDETTDSNSPKETP